MSLNMPPVLTEMHGDAIRSGILRNHHRFRRARIGRATRLPERRDVIDIHAEIDRIRFGHTEFL